jgi:hypothetical protein
MDVIGRGIIAGFLATVALSAIFDPMTTVARTAGVLPPSFGLLLHFLVGSVIWGVGFSLAYPFLYGASWMRGLLFGTGAWLLVMLTVMPLTRGGWFGLALGAATPAVMFIVHLVHGALLGGIYGMLDPNGGRRDDHDRFGHDENWRSLPR